MVKAATLSGRGLARSQWTEVEDKALMSLVKKYGEKSWSKISKCLQSLGRTGSLLGVFFPTQTTFHRNFQREDEIKGGEENSKWTNKTL